MGTKIKELGLLILLGLSGASAWADDSEDCTVQGGSGPTLSFQTSLSSQEGTGPKYRKIGLNGFPIPDEKPQQTEETDQESEETFIDAFNHTLSHQVTDIYVPMQGTDLALTVRRNWAPEIWSISSGLLFSERPDMPFGAGWKTNLCANIHFSAPFDYHTGVAKEPPYATVTDENGVSYRFLIVLVGTVTKYLPMPENRHQQEAAATSLDFTGSSFVFRRKFGTTLTYSEPVISIDELVRDTPISTDTFAGTHHSWSRLVKAVDRFGTQLTYSHSGSSLIPSTITSRGKTISITKGTGGRIASVTDPRGQVTTYTYSSQSITNPNFSTEPAPILIEVTRPDEDESTTSYTYNGVSQGDNFPRSINDPWYNKNFHLYLDLASITDPNNKTYLFGYAFDLSREMYYSTVVDGAMRSGYLKQLGNPRNITSVGLPDSLGGASFTNGANSSPVKLEWIDEELQMTGNREMSVTDSNGGSWNYVFTDPLIVRLTELQEMIYPTFDPLDQTLPMMIMYKTMTVATPEGGQMVATFEPSAGMALKSFKDVSSSASTTFSYTGTLPVLSWLPTAAAEQLPTQFYGDPTSQTNGLGDTKYFTYDNTWRVMKSIKDEKENITEYGINSSNGNRTWEVIRSVASGTAQRTEFTYGGSFPGIVQTKTLKVLPGDTSGAVDLVTTSSIAPTSGNIVAEIRGTGTTSYTYDANNNKTSTTDPNGNVTSFQYDEINRLTKTTFSDSTFKQFFYDARGNKIKETDENGHATLRIYDGLNRVTKEARDMNGSGTIDGADLVTEYTYNGLNARTSMKSPNGHTTTMTYDALNRLTKTKDPLNQETLFSYSGSNTGGLQFGRDFQPTSVTDPRGFVTLTTYDANYRPTQKKVQYAVSGTTPVYATTTFEYDEVGNVTKTTDPLGKETSVSYDALNRDLVTTYDDGTATRKFYTSTGLLWKTWDELSNATNDLTGRNTLYEYDDQGRQTKVHSPMVEIANTGTMARAVTETVYDKASNPVATINPLGFTWSSTFNNRNRKVAEVRPGTGSPTLRWAYDAAGNVTKTTDALGNETDTTYDEANRPVEVKQPIVTYYGSSPVHPTIETTYDKNGNALTVTDANGNTTTNTYDVLNRLTETEDAEGIVVENEYDAVGNRTAVIDGKNQRTEFGYDGLNRNTTVIYKGSGTFNQTTTFEYDGVNKTARIDAMNRRTEYAYDDRHRLTQVSYKNSSGTPVNNSVNATRLYVYDAAGNQLSVTEAAKSGKADVAYSYDALKRQLTETSSGLTHAYKYDLAGNRVYCLYGGLVVPLISAYDGQNRLITLTRGSEVTTYQYDVNGNNTLKYLPNGDMIQVDFDEHNRKIYIASISGVFGYFREENYFYDKVGNLLATEDYSYNSSAYRYYENSYDKIYRLVREKVIDGIAAVVSDTTYTYDEAHNRETRNRGGISSAYEYNGLNQLVGVVEGAKTVNYSYDENGNRCNRSGPLASDSADYYYDYEDRMYYAYDDGAGALHSFSYDYRTRRVELSDELVVTKVVFSGGLSVREFENGVSSVDYVRGSDWGGGVGGILYTSRGGVNRFNSYNARGDVVTQTDDDGLVTYEAYYEDYGKRSFENGSNLDRQRSNTKDQDIVLEGYETIVNEGFRFRDLETGVFLTRDPAGFVDGPNLYTYVNQNPWTAFDPEGLASQEAREAYPKLTFVLDIVHGLLSPIMGVARMPIDVGGNPQTTQENMRDLNAKLQNGDLHPLGNARSFGATITTAGMVELGRGGLKETLVENSASKVNQLTRRTVIDEMSSNLRNGTLSDIQARNWYNSTKVARSEVIENMRAAGASAEEIAKVAHEMRNEARSKARDLMSNRERAADLEKTKPNLTWDQVKEKYKGDYNKITEKSLESNKKVDKEVEKRRVSGER